jgi:hypothetical protein
MTPELHLSMMYNFDGARCTTTREPGGSPAPVFTLVRGATSRVWAIRADVPKRSRRSSARPRR